ncbi:MAG: cupin domain-containing protein [Acidobacteriia bacterium]|nr:cupin domain-containing protein [Terriglobia bacterium]
MLTRRDAIASTPLLLLLQAAGSAQPAPRGPIFQQELPNLNLDDWQVTVSEIVQAPGQAGRPHRHPGFVLVYVVDGELVTKVSGQAETAYKAGQVFWEAPGSTHEVSRNPSDSKPVKFVAFIFAKKGLQLTTPA